MLRPESLMMSYGYEPNLSEGAVKVPIFQTSTFVFHTAEEGKAFFEVAYGLRQRAPAEEPGLIYSRINNPDLQILEDRLTLWDDAEATLVFATGMAAISTTLLTYLRPGDVLVHSAPVYGGTEFLIDPVLPNFGVRASGVFGRLRGTYGRASALASRARQRARARRLPGDARQPDQRARRHRAVRDRRAWRLGRSAHAPARGGRQHLPRTALAAPPGTRCGSHRLLAHEVRRRAQ